MTILPPDYISYMAGIGPQEGGLIVEPGWFQLWPLDELESLNRDYQIQEYAPSFLGFGSSGGGELLAFDSEGNIVMLPFVGMSAQDAIIIASSWKDLVSKMEVND